MIWNIFQWQSLKTRVTVFTLVIFVASVWALAFYASQFLRDDIQRQLGDVQFTTVSFLAAEVNEELDNRLKALEAIGKTISPAMMENPAALQARLEQRPIFQSLFNGGIIAMRSDGTAIADVPLSNGRLGVNYMDRDYIAAALREGRSGIGRPVRGKRIAGPLMTMAAPIFDAKGQVIGALAGTTDLSKPNFLDKITESKYGRTGSFYIVDRRHRLIVTSSDKNRIMEQLPPPGVSPASDSAIRGDVVAVTYVNPRGVEVVGSAKGVPAANWYVGLIVPSDEAFAPIRAMQQRMLLGTIILTFLSGILIWWITWRMMRHQLSPMIEAAKTLDAIAEADRPAPHLPVRSKDEIGQLIASFNRLMAELEQRKALLRKVFDTSNVAIFLVNTEGRITQANQRMAEMFGRPLDNLVGTEYPTLVHASQLEVGRQKLTMLLADEVQVVDVERLYVRADGTEFWGHLTGKRLEGEQGILIGVVAVIEDITARKNAETERDDLSQRLLLATTSAKLGVWDWSIRENKTVWDERMFELYGVTPDSFSSSGDAWTNALHPEDKERAVTELKAALNGGKGFDTSFRIRRPDGSVRHIKANGMVLRAIDGTPERMIGINTDITDEKSLEEIHLRAQKLESLGTLTGGIAHDFNNILAAIRGNADLAAEDLGPDHPVTESLEEIKKASTRAHELVRRIMAFGRPKDAKVEAVNLSEVTDEVLKLLRPTLRAGIALKTAFPERGVHALADAGQIHEILVNLTTNAAYAIGSGEGSIEYRVELVSVDEDLAHKIPGLEPGKYACLTVTDTGCGMDAATVDRIFDAFYTTKPAGEGVGLGLSMVHGIMRSYGGAVTVQSSPERGSAFALYFPAALEQPTKTESEHAAPQSLLIGGRRVLFVDDEEALVSLAKRTISRLGHSVSGFSDPKAALEAFRAHPQDFDLVVTDLSMPQMSGINLAREVLSLRADIPVLLVSGNISEAEARLVAEAGVRAVLQKPVTVSELDATLDRLFRGDDPGERQNP